MGIRYPNTASGDSHIDPLYSISAMRVNLESTHSQRPVILRVIESIRDPRRRGVTVTKASAAKHGAVVAEGSVIFLILRLAHWQEPVPGR